MLSSPRFNFAAHAVAVLTVVIWGLTFIATKLLLVDFAPIEILFGRFALGLMALALMRPRITRLKERHHEWYFVAAGLTGVTLYFLFDNWALVFTTASNCSILTATAPLFSALISAFALKERRVGARFAIGFLLAMAGITLVSMRGDVGDLAFGNLGDLLAVCGALTWAIYSAILVKIADLGYETLAVTKRTFAWGLLFMAPLLPVMGASPDLTRLADPMNAGCLLFLGLGASAGCFVTWSFCVKRIGPTASMLYIYAQPLVTVAAGVAVLGEPFTVRIATGIVLTLAGLVVSQLEFRKR